LNWILVVLILGGLVVLAVLFVPPHTWVAGIVGYAGYSPAGGEFRFAPSGGDWFLLGAFAAFSGAGGFANLCLSNWARDKGYGMGQRAGYIPSAIGGRRLNLAHSGFRFEITDEALSRWRGWWRLVRVDQYVVFLGGALLGMLLPALLYVSFVPVGSDIRGLGVAAELAKAIGAVKGPLFGGAVAVMAVWVLFKTQLDLFDAQTRTITDIIWTGSRRVRSWRGGDVRVVYYSVLGISALWGVIALTLAQPIFLLQLAANMGGLVLAISALHLLYINTRLLPEALRPSRWRRLGLVATALFYGTFVALWLTSLL
ncbi:MAG: Nramp family divalent metal transporter, partial [Anaerolineales bacterium]